MKNQLEIFINSNLSRSLADIETRLGSLEEGGDQSDGRLVSRQSQLASIEKQLKAATSKLNGSDF